MTKRDLNWRHRCLRANVILEFYNNIDSAVSYKMLLLLFYITNNYRDLTNNESQEFRLFQMSQKSYKI